MKHCFVMMISMVLLMNMQTNLWATELKLASIFSDRMIVQRDQPISVWGTATSNEQVTVDFAGQQKCVTADAQGNWQTKLDPLPASTEPRVLTIRGQRSEVGGQSNLTVGKVVVKDVLVGDVWLCAGGLHVANRFINLLPDRDAAVAAANAEPTVPLLRFFSVKLKTARDVQPDAEGSWQGTGSGSMQNVPAEGYYLGRKLVAEMGVPIGIVTVAMAWPGQPIETWMSHETLTATPAARPIFAYYASDAWKMRTFGTYEERMKAWMDFCQKLPLNPPPKPQPNDTDTLARQEPSVVWNAMVAPLTRLAIRGIVWDHGEDDGSQQRATQYGQLLPSLIASWRQSFGNPSLPFVVVQARPVTPHLTDSRLVAELRDAQREVAAAANAACVVTIDLPQNPHHRDVGPRIANTILAKGYKKSGVVTDGPELVSTEIKGNKVILSFRNTQGGLVAKGGQLKGFAIAASMFRWVWADAIIKGETIEVTAPTVDKPEGVRYAYQDFPEKGATLSNGAGCPAAPFRTDTHLTCSGTTVDPSARRLGYNARCDLGIEDPLLPRILIIGDSISGHYINFVIAGMHGRANVIGESSMRTNGWASMQPDFYRSDWASRGDNLKNFLKSRGPFDIVHFNNGIHNFSRANPGDEKPYAEQLRTVVSIIRASGAICLFANSTGTIGDNTIKNSPHYLTNCKVFNAAAEKVMAELNVPVTDIYGVIQPRIKELISPDLIHPKAEASPIMADAIIARLNEALGSLRSASKSKKGQ
ncbi:MAG: sialate O-acetylesterase [bacterium]